MLATGFEDLEILDLLGLRDSSRARGQWPLTKGAALH